MIKTYTTIAAAVALTAGSANAALVASNLGFESGLTGWTETSLGSDALEVGADFRTAANPDNWHDDLTAGNISLLLEGDNSNEFGTLGQALTGTAEAGTYTFSLADAGVASFGGGTNTTLTYGFSLDGTNFIAGSVQTLTQGTELFTPAGGAAFNGAVTYDATGLETNLHILLSTTGDGRHIATAGSTDLAFVAVPEPSSTALLGLGGLALILRRRK